MDTNVQPLFPPFKLKINKESKSLYAIVFSLKLGFYICVILRLRLCTKFQPLTMPGIGKTY